MDIDRICAWVARAQSDRSRKGYPQALRQVVGTNARNRRAAGATWAVIEGEIGLSKTTMRSWITLTEGDGFRQLQVIDPPPTIPTPTPLMLTSPRGFVVTGGSIEDLARLLSVLG